MLAVLETWKSVNCDRFTSTPRVMLTIMVTTPLRPLIASRESSTITSYTVRSGNTAHQSTDKPRDDLGRRTRYLRSSLGVLNRSIIFRLCKISVGR